MSVNSTSPETLFGGTWVRIQGRFLLGAGSNTANTNETFGKLAANQINRSVNEQGGEVKHKLTVSEMPSHTHEKNISFYSGANVSISEDDTFRTGVNGTTFIKSKVIAQGNNTGGDAAHNNMPPYYVVYMWRRTA